MKNIIQALNSQGERGEIQQCFTPLLVFCKTEEAFSTILLKRECILSEQTIVYQETEVPNHKVSTANTALRLRLAGSYREVY